MFIRKLIFLFSFFFNKLVKYLNFTNTLKYLSKNILENYYIFLRFQNKNEFCINKTENKREIKRASISFNINI